MAYGDWRCRFSHGGWRCGHADRPSRSANRLSRSADVLTQNTDLPFDDRVCGRPSGPSYFLKKAPARGYNYFLTAPKLEHLATVIKLADTLGLQECEHGLDFCTVRAYIENEWSDNVVDSDKKYHETGTSSRATNGQISATWKHIRTAYTFHALQVQFTNAQIVEYFITRTVSDGHLSADFKSIKSQLSISFVVAMYKTLSSDEKNLYMRADCLPEIRKDHVYKLILTMKRTTLDVISAQCVYAGGKLPQATCKHIPALCYGSKISVNINQYLSLALNKFNNGIDLVKNMWS